MERESSGREEGVKLEKKQSKKPKIKLGDDNRMRDFVNEEDEDTPYLKKPLSFG